MNRYRLASVTVALLAGSLCADDKPKPKPPREMPTHNLKSTTTVYWVIYGWTDAKAYRPGEPVACSLCLLTETSDAFVQPTVILVIKGPDGKEVLKRKLDTAFTKVSQSPLRYEWSTKNLSPDPADGKRSSLEARGDYAIRFEFQFGEDDKATIEGISVNVGGG